MTEKEIKAEVKSKITNLSEKATEFFFVTKMPAKKLKNS